MFDWLTYFLNAIGSFIVQALEWFLSLPLKLINALIYLWYWMREETLRCIGNLIWDSFNVLSSLSPWNFTVDEQLLHKIYSTANLFFPVDDLIVILIFLLETWLMVKVAKYSVWLALIFFKPRKPNLKFLNGGE
jgi:hypothetical protein